MTRAFERAASELAPLVRTFGVAVKVATQQPVDPAFPDKNGLMRPWQEIAAILRERAVDA